MTTATAIRTEGVTPLDLAVGDVVVLAYGVRAVLDREPVRYPDHNSGRPVVAWSARLLDPTAARVADFPVGWCDRDENGDYRWTVQGNALATVTREVPEPVHQDSAQVTAPELRRGNRVADDFTAWAEVESHSTNPDGSVRVVWRLANAKTEVCEYAPGDVFTLLPAYGLLGD